MQTDIGLLVLRVLIPGMMLFGHGWGKLIGFSQKAAFFPDPFHVGSTLSLGMAVFAEVFCCLALMLGVLTRWLAIPPLITMLVAVFIIHAGDPWSKKEFALLYLIPFVTVFLAGPGKYSLDKILFKNK